MTGDARLTRLLTVVATARREGWYQDDPRWTEVEEILTELGYGSDWWG